MRSGQLLFTLAAIACFGGIRTVGAYDVIAPHHFNHQILAVRIAERYLLPSYEHLDKTVTAQAADWRAFCASPDQTDLEKLRLSFHAAADAWAAIEHIHFGPISNLNRHDRFYYWPERRNATGRGLTKLLAEPDPAALAPERFAQASVAVQGLPALERLLFEAAASNAAWSGPSQDGTHRCTLGRTIANNLASVARGTLDEWRGPKGILALLADGEPHPAYFTDPTEALRQLVSDLLFGFQVMADIKLAPVIGADITRARPQRAEAWRSGRPLRNLQSNIDGLLRMYQVFSQSISADLDLDMRHNFTLAQQAVAGLPEDLAAAVADTDRRPALALTVKTIRHAREQIGKKLPPAINVNISFNLNDGD